MARASRFVGLSFAVAALLAAGCGTAAPGLKLTHRAVQVQREAWDMAGTFQVKFRGLGGYKTLATREDVHSVRITLTSPRLLTPLVKVVGPEELNQLVVTVPFADVPTGDVTVKVQALNKDDHVIGVKESASTVTAGQTTILQLAVRLDATAGEGNLAAAITFEEGTPEPSPTPSPAATPTPSPTPTATPTATPSPTPSASPVLLQSSRLVRHLFTNPEAEISLKNTAAVGASAKVYVYFYNDNTLRDSQAREIPLEAGQEMTFRLKSNVYSVNKVNVVVK